MDNVLKKIILINIKHVCTAGTGCFRHDSNYFSFLGKGCRRSVLNRPTNKLRLLTFVGPAVNKILVLIVQVLWSFLPQILCYGH